MRACPAKDCNNRIADEMVACTPHWYALPAELRTRILRLYRRKPGTELHRAAVLEAVRLLHGRELRS